MIRDNEFLHCIITFYALFLLLMQMLWTLNIYINIVYMLNLHINQIKTLVSTVWHIYDNWFILWNITANQCVSFMRRHLSSLHNKIVTLNDLVRVPIHPVRKTRSRQQTNATQRQQYPSRTRPLVMWINNGVKVQKWVGGSLLEWSDLLHLISHAKFQMIKCSYLDGSLYPANLSSWRLPCLIQPANFRNPTL